MRKRGKESYGPSLERGEMGEENPLEMVARPIGSPDCPPIQSASAA